MNHPAPTPAPPSQALDWESRYQDGKTGWERGALSPGFSAWMAAGAFGRPPARVLIPGAGRSHEPLALAEAGFTITVADIAPSAVAWQHDRIAPHGGTAILADLLAWEPERPFDLIYDQTCLCALPPSIWEEYARRLAGWTQPGGVLAALFIQTGREGGPPFDCPLPRMRELFPATLWRWPSTLPPLVPHPRLAGEQPALLTRRAQSAIA